MWWGFSQALDLLDEFGDVDKKQKSDGDKKESTCNVLLMGQFDGRHMLNTIARRYRHKEDININFYVYEPLLENVARQLLFTTLALEPPELIGIAEKTLTFMELYGNSLIRPATAKHLNKLSKQLLNMVTNISYAEQILPSVSLNNLKYKERDQLEIIFKYWASNDKSFNILQSWDERLRKHLGVRYDSRLGVFDWDYHMRYHSFGAELLDSLEYKKFREKGISFHFEDTDPCIPNYTLASAIFSSGSKIQNYGYMGDIFTGPYVTFGLKCEDEDMLKKISGKPYKKATDVTERNIMRMFYEIQHQEPFVPLVDDDNQLHPLVVMKDTSSDLKIQDSDSYFGLEENKIKIKDACDVYKSLDMNNSKIIFLPKTALNDYPAKSDYENFFHLGFISQTMVLKNFKLDLVKMFKPQSTLIVDTPKFLISYGRKDLEKFKKNLEALMNDCQCKSISSFNCETDEFARFRIEK